MSNPGNDADKARLQEAAVLQAIETQRATNPLIGAIVVGKEVLQRLLAGMKGSNGVQVESLLTALGALAGYACQAGIIADCVSKKIEAVPFTVITGKDGRTYFFGDALNKPLLEDRLSVWSVCAGMLQRLGSTLPDLHEVVRHVSSTVGTTEFDRPRMPTGHQAGDLPANYVRAMWPAFLPLAQKFCSGPGEWHLAFALAAQEAIEMGKSTIEPSKALLIVIESAIIMSKMHPQQVFKPA